MKSSKYNLLPYFIDDERSLAKRRAYVASCEKFFNKIKKESERASEQAREGGRVGPKGTSLKKNKNT